MMKETILYYLPILKAMAVPLIVLALIPIMVWMERKGSAFIQDRIGPNRAHVGPIRLKGFLHMIADAIKFLNKESFTPKYAYKPLYYLAPFFAVAPVLATVGIIPFAEPVTVSGQTIYFQGIHLETGLIFFFAIGALHVYAVVLGGWASNSRYSLLGGLRATAQLISYEVALILTILGVLMIHESTNLNTIIKEQSSLVWKWGICTQPLGFLLFFVSGLAETERIPFDLPEAESEIVAGYMTEYSGLKFSMYMLGQYVTVLAVSSIVVALFLGGWQLPFISAELCREYLGTALTAGLQIVTFGIKLFVMIWIFVWIRWTLPRFRYDQLMSLGWKSILPLALLNLFATGFIVLLVSG